MTDRDTLTSPFYTAPRRRALPGTLAMRNLGVITLAMLGLCCVITQWLASRLGYPDALGEPILQLGNGKLYEPLSWLRWYIRWHSSTVPEVAGTLHTAKWIMLAGCAAMTVFMLIKTKRTNDLIAGESVNLHGSAHWASPSEVLRTGLLGAGRGVYIGGWKHPKAQTVHYLRHDGPEHVIAFAPTRSGKGVGLVLPTLLSWPHSALVYDIKGENWALTSGWRRKEGGNHVVKFEPTASDGSSARFNPLAEVRVGTDREVADVQNIMTMIVDPDGKGLQDHWQKSAQALLVGVGLHVLYASKQKTLNGMIQFLTNPTRNSDQTMQFMLDTDHDMTGLGWPLANGAPNYCHPVVAACARDMLNKAAEERSSVLSSAISYLTLFRDPVVARNTSMSDFKVSDLMHQDKPVSLYLVVPPSDKDRLRPLIRLMVNQIVRSLTERMEFERGRSVAGYKHRLLLMLDEFPSLGKLDVFQESLAFIAGYGMKAYLIIQDISQLHTAYGKDESIFSNCHVRVAYAPNKVETAELLSKMSGTATIVKRNLQHSGTLFTLRSNISASMQETQRPLLTVDEVMRLPGSVKDAGGNVVEAGDMLIFMAGQAPIYGKQILYFLDPTFASRAMIKAPVMSDVLVEEPAAGLPPGMSAPGAGVGVGGPVPGSSGAGELDPAKSDGPSILEKALGVIPRRAAVEEPALDLGGEVATAPAAVLEPPAS
jgi:type IV secretion system protein VirD4